MRTLAIGDMHGCLTALDLLLAEVRLQPDDLLVTLGDYVDRGPDSKGVLDRLLELSGRCRLVSLRGNHEVMMLRAWQLWSERQNWRKVGGLAAWLSTEETPSSEEKDWLACGGRQTLASYAGDGKNASLADVPDAHWQFLEQRCVDWHETETHLFAHANAYPDHPMAEQPDYMLHWEKMISPRQHDSGKILVCGHTPQKSGRPHNWGHTICIDTWVYGEGWLTCLDTASGQFWQANQRGETRTSRIGLPRE